MKRQIIYVLTVVFAFSAVSAAQVKTVTNADLEKYRRKRLAAEKELRENYKELGFPSPEERKKQAEKSAKERSELAKRLREERLAKEAIRAIDKVYTSSSADPQYSDSDNPPEFTDYQGQIYTTTYYYPYYRTYGRYGNNRSYRRYGGYWGYRNRYPRSGVRVRLGNGGFRVRGVFGTQNRTRRNTNFGPSRRLTRQNLRKSRHANRAFENRLYLGGTQR